jgi:hypothetical protein
LLYTQLDLLTSGLTLTKLSSNAALTATSTSIQNTASALGSTTTPAPLHGVTRSAATGSVRINGFGITSVSFRVFLKGDGGTVRDAAGNPATANNGNFIQWSDQLNHIANGTTGTLNSFSGDLFLLGLSLQPCHQITNPSSTQNVCVGSNGSNITVNTTTNATNSIRFVKFTSDQMAGTTPTAAEAAAIYAGSAMATVTPTGSSSPFTATYTWNNADFPSAGNYYVYAILNPNPGGDCYLVQEIIINRNALPTPNNLWRDKFYLP